MKIHDSYLKCNEMRVLIFCSKRILQVHTQEKSAETMALRLQLGLQTHSKKVVCLI